MWTIIALTGCAIGLWLVVRRFGELDDFPTRVLLLGLWTRNALQAFPDDVSSPMFAGFSLVALASIATAIAFVTVADHQLLRLRALLPLYAILAIVLISGIINRTLIGVVNDFVKWAYFLGVAMLTYRAIMLYGTDRTMRALLCTMATPALLLVASVVTGNAKATELDGSISYIGGYYHESMFSTILFALLAVVSFITWRWRWFSLFMLVFAVGGIFLTNYRTTIIATLPVVAVLLATMVLNAIRPKYRAPLIIIAAILVIEAIPLALDSLPDRYAEVSNVLEDASVFGKIPLEFTWEERIMFSGRVYLWAEYLYSYDRGTLLQHIIGYGPGEYVGRFRHNAHNTFISYLWEYGALGLIAILVFSIHNIVLVWRVSDMITRWRLLGFNAGIVILSLASMPLWTIEGLIIYAIAIGYTWSRLHSEAADRAGGGAAATVAGPLYDRPSTAIGRL